MEAIKLVTDGRGRKSVIVPFRKWRKLNEDYQKLQKKLQVFSDIQEGFSEIRRARKTGRELQSLNDFLNEIKS